MEHIDGENSEPYISYVDRMLMGYLDATIGQPILVVSTLKGEQDLVVAKGINSGMTEREVLVENTGGNIYGHDIDEHMLVAGFGEIQDYVSSQLAGWRVDAAMPEKIGNVVSLLTAAQQLNVELPGFDIGTELSYAWQAITELKATDHQALSEMLYEVHESELSESLDQLMRETVQGARSIGELYDQPLLRAYMEVLFGNNKTPIEELTLLQGFVDTLPLEK